MKAMPIHSAALTIRGMAARIWLSMLIAGPEIASMPSTCSAAIATGMMISAKTRMPAARARLARVVGARLVVAPVAGPAAATGGGRLRAAVGDARLAEQPVDVGRGEQGLDQLADDPRDDQADEEDQPGADQARQELEDRQGQRVDRLRGSGRCRGTAARP